jgi:anti-sigma B factor antagonist
MMNEQYLITKSDRYTLIQLQVEKLDTLAAPALKSEFVVLNNEGVKNMIIDLSETRYCDSSGLSAILVANRLCKNMGGVLIVSGLQDSVKKLISISQLDSILTITPDRTSAIDRLVAETVERGQHD